MDSYFPKATTLLILTIVFSFITAAGGLTYAIATYRMETEVVSMWQGIGVVMMLAGSFGTAIFLFMLIYRLCFLAEARSEYLRLLASPYLNNQQ